EDSKIEVTPKANSVQPGSGSGTIYVKNYGNSKDEKFTLMCDKDGNWRGVFLSESDSKVAIVEADNSVFCKED
uniref:Uncharacterized protein n=1 Tax=Plectus sambesii TaxID=2011161 RepID=A0A914VBF4_9BILA